MRSETDPAQKKQRMRPTLFKGPQPYRGFFQGSKGLKLSQKSKNDLMGLSLFLIILLGFILILAI